jgi:YidC/Oxa1 family membrane protein insertase
MDRKSLIGYLLIFAILIGYTMFIGDTAEMAEKEQAKIEASGGETPADNETAVSNTGSAEESEVVIDTAAEMPVEVETPVETYTLENEQALYEFTSKGGRISKVQLKDYKRADSSALILLDKANSSFNYTIVLKDEVVRTEDLDFTVFSESPERIVLEAKLGSGKIKNSYELKDNYILDYSMSLEGLQKEILPKNKLFSLDWKQNLLLQEYEMDEERDAQVSTSVYYKFYGDSDVDDIGMDEAAQEKLTGRIHWIGYKQKFFTSALIFPNGSQKPSSEVNSFEPEHEDYVREMGASIPMEFDFSANKTYDFQFYYGPNHYKTMKNLDIEMEEVIPLGWGIFSWVNKFLIIPSFNFLHDYISNYGIVILLLTLFIKLLLIFPMFKIYTSGAKMKLLKPELDQIKEKTGGDMQKAQQEQMKLYKKMGVNPFGGCLPQLIQFPILIAMFRFFPSSIELRQQSFLWAHDLSTYDSIFTFPGGFEIPFYGGHVSLFTLLMAGSTFLYSYFNTQNSPGGGQMKFIIYFMPLMLLFWFNSYASALSYYYFLANMITFGQNWVFKTFIVDEEKLRKQLAEHSKKKGKAKKSKWQKRMEEAMKKRGMDPNQLNK